MGGLPAARLPLCMERDSKYLERALELKVRELDGEIKDYFRIARSFGKDGKNLESEAKKLARRVKILRLRVWWDFRVRYLVRNLVWYLRLGAKHCCWWVRFRAECLAWRIRFWTRYCL